MSGSDTTGALSKKAKVSFWKAFKKADEQILEAISKLGSAVSFLHDERLLIEKFVCQVYVPGTNTKNVKYLRWWIYKERNSGRKLTTNKGIIKTIC